MKRIIQNLSWFNIPVILASFLICASASVQAQFFSLCQTGEINELNMNIASHEEHMFRLQNKAITGRYLQGQLPTRFEPIKLQQIVKRLGELEGRRAAVLFHAYDEKSKKLCSWLIPANAPPIFNVAQLENAETIKNMRPQLAQAIGVAKRSTPLRKSRMSTQQFELAKAALEQELAQVKGSDHARDGLSAASKLLLPDTVKLAILKHRIDTLIVIPIFDTGVIPLSALPIDATRSLLDLASVVIAPGFFAFKEPLLRARHSFPDALVVGNPYAEDPNWRLPLLRGAEAEAREVATMTGATALIGPQATKKSILAQLKRNLDTSLVYIASHGVADGENPMDGGYMALSDQPWSASEISKAPLGRARPLVVLSACQTGLGKTFDVGMIGLARAWQQAGASTVVMSLWAVGDVKTRELMTSFMRHTKEKAPDQALREAMLELRRKDSRLAGWGSFSVFGMPEL